MMLPSLWTLGASFVALYLARRWKLVRAVAQTFTRDIIGIYRFIGAAYRFGQYNKAGETVAHAFDRTVEKHASKVCFVYEEHRWTFQQIRELSNQIGNYFQSQGFRKGDSIVLFMHNRPEFICVWLGLSRIGVVSYLINTNLRQQSLKYSIQIANPKAVIYGQELAEAIGQVLEKEVETRSSMLLFSVDDASSSFRSSAALSSMKNMEQWEQQSVNLKEQLEKENVPKTNPVVEEEQRPTFTDTLLCIYTSGTTGLPKAAVVKQSRFIGAAIHSCFLNGIKSSDVFYCCLPLYHTAAEFFGAGLALFYGNTVIIKKKFSARSFWKDCKENNVTVALHIGELCRYLLSQPVAVEEKQHKVRLMIGNGLRPEIWTTFVTRFRIARISEFYASTEGNCNMLNFDNRVGAVGFVPILLYRKYPVGVFRVDLLTGELVRDSKTGLAVRCEPNEPGELIGQMSIGKGNPYREFNGYANDVDSTQRKVCKNIFTTGDCGFRTGDVLVMDDLGYFYFKDRAGDTFRWKGENVSTNEVEASISSICGLSDCVVYGVEIPGTDGKAGMAAIADPNKTLDLKALAVGIQTALPSYARPLFIRVTKQLESTGTFKLKKLELQSEGFDVTKIKDSVFVSINNNYVPMAVATYEQIVHGNVRL